MLKRILTLKDRAPIRTLSDWGGEGTVCVLLNKEIHEKEFHIKSITFNVDLKST